MILRQIQELIGGIYDVPIAHDVYDFLVTERPCLPGSSHAGDADEELIIVEERDAVGVSLYLDGGLLERLRAADPIEHLDASNVADYWTALEGVSHFMYFAWNAAHDKPVSLLALEMQAEIDKYIASYALLRRQSPAALPRRAAAPAVRAHARGSGSDGGAAGHVPRGEPLCREVLPPPGARPA